MRNQGRGFFYGAAQDHAGKSFFNKFGHTKPHPGNGEIRHQRGHVMHSAGNRFPLGVTKGLGVNDAEGGKGPETGAALGYGVEE